MKKINLKTYFKKRKQRLSVFGVSPEFDWKFIFWLAVCIVVGGIISATYLYIQVNNGSLFEVTEDTSVQTELENKKKKIEEKVTWLEGRNFDERVGN